MVPWYHDKALAWDVTGVDTLARSHIESTSKKAAAAAEEAESEKRSKYSALSDNSFFQPIGFETLGSWGADAVEFIAKVVKRIAERSGGTRSSDFVRQRISVEIQRFNAVSILTTLLSPAN